MRDGALFIREVLIPTLEGHESNSSIDPGGHTLFGLSKPTRERLGLSNQITIDEAVQVYQRHYWTLYGCEKMEPVVAWLVSDAFVNHSPTSAAKIIQRAHGQPIVVDGKYGPKTMAACVAVEDVATFLDKYLFHRRRHFALRSGELISRYASEKRTVLVNQVIQQEHGWQRRLDKLVRAMWQHKLLRREPSSVETNTKTTAAVIAGGAAAAVVSSPAVLNLGISDIVAQSIQLASSGDVGTVGLAGVAAGWAYKRYIKSGKIVPKKLRSLLGLA